MPSEDMIDLDPNEDTLKLYDNIQFTHDSRTNNNQEAKTTSIEPSVEHLMDTLKS